MKKNTKKIIRKRSGDFVEFDSSEISLLLEAVKKQIDRVREERFYRHEHPDGFYEIYLQRYYDLIKKLDRTLPVYVKLPKF